MQRVAGPIIFFFAYRVAIFLTNHFIPKMNYNKNSMVDKFREKLHSIIYLLLLFLFSVITFVIYPFVFFYFINC
jgi:hypothetical protein